MAKKKRLPRNFGDLLNAGDLDALIAVFDACEIDARDGPGGRTALGMYGCPVELARWLIAHGADLGAAGRHGGTPIGQHISVGHDAIVRLLLDAGVNIEARIGSNSYTPLQQAASSHHPSTVRLLLDRGADPLALAWGYATALQVGLRTCRNADIPAMADIAEALIAAGTPITGDMRAEVERIGNDFEFHRERFNPDALAEVEVGLARLYRLFAVAPVAARRTHDGISPITVRAGDWREQHRELWQWLVPSTGAALTVQGEVIRISGRIHIEQADNGGTNWDGEYRKMVDALRAHLGSGTPLADAELADATRYAADVRTGHGSDAALDDLCQLAVRWVLANPAPMKLDPPAYRR
jgi:hypothetical protein